MYGRVPIETTVVPGWLSQSARAIACVCAFGIIPILSIPGCSLDGFTIDESKLPPPRPPSFVLDLEFGSSGTGSGQFLLPTALSRDSANRIFVVDTSGEDRKSVV